MRKGMLVTAQLVLGLLAFPGSALASEITCEGLIAKVEQNLDPADLGVLRQTLADARQGKSDCPAKTVYCIGRRVSLALVDQAYAKIDLGDDGRTIREIMEGAFEAGRTWQSAASLAEIVEAASKDPGRFDRAAELYQLAINDIDEIDTRGEECPGERKLLPTPEQARDILEKARTASLLAPNYVVAPVTRSGEPGGIFIGSLRGVVPESTPVPITFEYDSDKFTDKGRKAAAQLAEMLQQEKQGTTIYLSGHTDARGTDAYNCELSKSRLVAVQRFLETAGYEGSVVLDARGESVPVLLDDPSRYSQEELEARNRRVELRENPISGTSPCA